MRSLGIVLLCCPGLVAVEIESLRSKASFLLAELAACRQPKLQELAIRDTMEGSEDEGRFVQLLDCCHASAGCSSMFRWIRI